MGRYVKSVGEKRYEYRVLQDGGDFVRLRLGGKEVYLYWSLVN